MFDNACPGITAHTVKKNITAAAATPAAAATGHTIGNAAMAYAAGLLMQQRATAF